MSKVQEWGNTNASLALGKIYEEGIGVKPDLLESFTHYRNAARTRHPLALYKMGELLEKGDGLEEEQTRQTTIKQILGSYTAAKDNGSTKAVVRLAQMYEKGEYSHRVDLNKALNLYQSVVDEEEVAMNAIGSEWYKRKDYKQAVQLFTKAAEMGDPTAMNNLGTWYELGKGVDKDILRAYDLYEDAAKKG